MARLLKVSRQPDGRPEIFYSIQGEGINIGKPAVFLRLALCNLACTWCDTKYTWDWEHYDAEEQIMEMSLEQVEPEILGHNCNYLVITGGEPMIQQRELVPLLKCLKNKESYTEIETNATILPEPELVKLIDHWSLSPKLRNSGNAPPLREVPECYRFFSALSSSHFKYVVQDEDDLAEVQSIAQRYNLPAERIILMPEARDKETLVERTKWLAEVCKNQGYLFSTRLQIMLWGNQRGV